MPDKIKLHGDVAASKAAASAAPQTSDELYFVRFDDDGKILEKRSEWVVEQDILTSREREQPVYQPSARYWLATGFPTGQRVNDVWTGRMNL